MTDYDASRTGDVATNETSNLIAASKVEGTNVYNRQGESLGTVYDVMLDKRSGEVAYAVMSFGGFLGMGESYHPVPWDMLEYDESEEGYVVDLNKEQLEGAPSFDERTSPDWSSPEYSRSIDHYYGVARPAI
ncbi:PRC-barrel domain-containing protein [Rhizobium sp. ARZ01]|uniref:PRC-barrel domain-containing protein n=1 Tax=Rhizobium sp. ARZ01 TaxID=2769313 RepID=UPI001785A787|nr:PRC-barrel domain-containing protein [Rhizobium sp. ARZ01]MBD9375190.1 PRC-barrel domain-containing protein [Rhizobium sp. ARZ01]